jgi:hypothetical protein
MIAGATADVPAASQPTTYQPPMATCTDKELAYLESKLLARLATQTGRKPSRPKARSK